jgi:hypothetical protein
MSMNSADRAGRDGVRVRPNSDAATVWKSLKRQYEAISDRVSDFLEELSNVRLMAPKPRWATARDWRRLTRCVDQPGPAMLLGRVASGLAFLPVESRPTLLAIAPAGTGVIANIFIPNVFYSQGANGEALTSLVVIDRGDIFYSTASYLSRFSDVIDFQCDRDEVEEFGASGQPQRNPKINPFDPGWFPQHRGGSQQLALGNLVDWVMSEGKGSSYEIARKIVHSLMEYLLARVQLNNSVHGDEFCSSAVFSTEFHAKWDSAMWLSFEMVCDAIAEMVADKPSLSDVASPPAELPEGSPKGLGMIEVATGYSISIDCVDSIGKRIIVDAMACAMDRAIAWVFSTFLLCSGKAMRESLASVELGHSESIARSLPLLFCSGESDFCPTDFRGVWDPLRKARDGTLGDLKPVHLFDSLSKRRYGVSPIFSEKLASLLMQRMIVDPVNDESSVRRYYRKRDEIECVRRGIDAGDATLAESEAALASQLLEISCGLKMDHRGDPVGPASVRFLVTDLEVVDFTSSINLLTSVGKGRKISAMYRVASEASMAKSLGEDRARRVCMDSSVVLDLSPLYYLKQAREPVLFSLRTSPLFEDGASGKFLSEDLISKIPEKINYSAVLSGHRHLPVSLDVSPYYTDDRIRLVGGGSAVRPEMSALPQDMYVRRRLAQGVRTVGSRSSDTTFSLAEYASMRSNQRRTLSVDKAARELADRSWASLIDKATAKGNVRFGMDDRAIKAL